MTAALPVQTNNPRRFFRQPRYIARLIPTNAPYPYATRGLDWASHLEMELHNCPATGMPQSAQLDT